MKQWNGGHQRRNALNKVVPFHPRNEFVYNYMVFGIQIPMRQFWLFRNGARVDLDLWWCSCNTEYSGHIQFIMK